MKVHGTLSILYTPVSPSHPTPVQVRAHPDNAEAWRLLGTVHAENDDDQQVRVVVAEAVVDLITADYQLSCCAPARVSANCS